MKRISTATRVVDKFGAGKDGYTDGDVIGGVPATDLEAALFDNLQEELANIVEGAGIVLDGAVRTQVFQAVKRLFGGNVTTVNAANSPLVLTADHAGLILMDATAGNISATLPAVSALTGSSLKFRAVRVDAAANSATVSCAGAETFVGGATSFTLSGQGDYRGVESNLIGLWVSTAAPTVNISGQNRLINGRFNVDQRNAFNSKTFTAGAALAYCADRWYGYCTGANISGQAISVSGKPRYRFTGAVSNTGGGLGQRIEAVNSCDMVSSNAVLQVRAMSTSLAALNWAVYHATTVDAFGTLAAPTRTLIANGTFAIGAVEAMYSAGMAVPVGATTGLEVVLSWGALTAGNTLTLGDVQLEAGGMATPVERLSIDAVRHACQRYYWKTFPQSVVPATGTGSTGALATSSSGSSGGTFYGISVQLPTTMRVTPGVVFYNPVSANTNFYNATNSTDSGASVVNYNADRGFFATGTYVGGDANGHLFIIHAVADAEL